MEVVSKAGCDVIVVGTGPGGATVARELARRGKKVLILEWGPAVTSGATPPSTSASR